MTKDDLKPHFCYVKTDGIKFAKYKYVITKFSREEDAQIIAVPMPRAGTDRRILGLKKVNVKNY